MENCTFSWIDEASNSPTLTDINIKIKEGSIVSIVGPVGCGKSSLISAILGEMYQIEGSINVKVCIRLSITKIKQIAVLKQVLRIQG